MTKETNNNLDVPSAEVSSFQIQHYDSPPGVEKQHVVKLEHLEIYVKTMSENGGFAEQYNMLKTGQLKDCTAGLKLENKNKNRYSTLLPYDETRVVLNRLKNDPNSDYINANYTDGYNAPKAYICTQGPLENTVSDFWRLVWQSKICKIIMTCNTIEESKTKCEKYWPDTTSKHGDISITLVSQEEFVDYTIRTFKLHKSGISAGRQVKQFHFTAWPDHGVPSCSLSLVKVLKLVKNYRPASKASILLHCSAGVGRTGTLILLDSALQMMKAENQVDVLGLLYTLRKQRVNLVETVEQYAFVHRSLVEILFGDNPCRPAEQLPLYLNKLRKASCQQKITGLQVQFERLRKETTKFQEEDKVIITSHPEDKTNNRSSDYVTLDCAKPRTFSSTSTLYKNMTRVHGYGRKEAIIVSQYPLSSVTKDFWQLVYDSSSQTLVVLNELTGSDECCSAFWPESGSQYYGNLKVHHAGTDRDNGITIRSFKLKNPMKNEKSRTIKMFQLRGWQKEDISPPSVESIIRILYKVDRWQHKSRVQCTIVMCMDGVSASGFYCATSFLFQQKQLEKEMDVFEAVRTIRLNRPSFIQSVEQYRWVYEVACGFQRVKSPY
ncbi:receptor-type tyrosine-protein phosphatase T-like isoform X2 [Tachypleus tridentatus]|uniref:receptor-type tyrosine-protein phosphatase T-like isoform X2 n=1 Tax=Tachypleus tridentatus TaxID=6853 RepID=UPI003FD1E221